MESADLVLAFVGVKVALGLLFWWSLSRGLALGARIEARKEAEREAAVSRSTSDEAMRPAA